MIDINKLRQSLGAIQPEEVNELLDRLEAAEKDIALKERIIDSLGSELNAVANERDAMRALVVMRFDHDYPPQFAQGHNLHELNEPVTAEHCRWFVAEIERLRTDCDALRAKIEAMEKQEPVAWQSRSRPSWGAHQWGNWESCSPGYAQDITKSPTLHDWQYEARPLYALPGAKGE